jgi:hypothetical protein
MTLEDFLNKPYNERQLIMFSSKVSEPSMINAESAIEDMSSKIKKKDLLYLAPLLAGVILPIPLALLTAAELSGLLGISLKEIFKNNKLVTYMPMTYVKDLSLPKGNIIDGSIYIGHPIESQLKYYYPINEFHLSLHRQKSHELINILRSLQLTRFRIRHVEGYRDLSSFSVDASAKVEKVTIGAGGGKKSESSSDYDIIWEETAVPSAKKPKLPKNLIWYDYEDEWQLAVERALKEGMKSISFKYSYKNDFGANINWKLVLANVKAKVETQKYEFQRTIWEVTLER